MNRAIAIKFTLTIMLVMFSAVHSKGQYIIRDEYMTPFEVEAPPKYKKIVSLKINRFNGKAYISWMVMNDTLEGVFAIYKSSNFNSIKPVECLVFPKGLVLDVPLLFSVVDSSLETGYDTYHIVKVDRNTLFDLNEHVVYRNSAANLKLPEEDRYLEQKRLAKTEKDLYSQGF
jgi:hypothetical protein